MAEVKLIDKFNILMAGNPIPSQIIAFYATYEENERVGYLLERNRNEQLTSDERQELNRFIDADHVITTAKVNAFVKLNTEAEKGQSNPSTN